LRTVLTFVVLVAAVPFVARDAFAGSREILPGYRYPGVVENARGAPTHYVGPGDGITLSFFDAFSQGRKSLRYTVCIGRPGRRASRCWARSASFGFGKLTFPTVLPGNVPLGSLTARWLVAGRTVALWPFFYAR